MNPIGLSLCLFTSVNYSFIMTKTHYCWVSWDCVMFSAVTQLSEKVSVGFGFSILGCSGWTGVANDRTKAGYVTVAASCVISVNYTSLRWKPHALYDWQKTWLATIMEMKVHLGCASAQVLTFCFLVKYLHEYLEMVTEGFLNAPNHLQTTSAVCTVSKS